MSPKGEEPQEPETESPSDAEDEANANESPASDLTVSPFSEPALQGSWRMANPPSEVEIKRLLDLLSHLDDENEPASPSEPQAEESPFTTPAVEEVERERPDGGDND
jgi:hypothetical protein